ncbi:hypothetical protein [Alteriqipengyuania lutimaris]|uniref:Uncharacterized protein n=1 Tax=Alteriqipengyuania lutimaris TaxID=1538146 RepID=A0A395LJ41_9SPHN|nr:hypothetical protein [Alteriqipengyuania lutimaris]MBB3034028.1 hypothetical protein [Alteriqipengyuania lutimaris]RDS77026.1 hypothetical protein DL238_04975 [Alteriqipengyuania lutimaris]
MHKPAPPLSLVDRLRTAADAWAQESDATLAKLGRVVVNHSGFFNDLDRMPRGPSTDTLEKFARYLIDPANWPEGAVSQEAVELAHVVGVTAETSTPSSIKTDDVSLLPSTGSGQERERAA